MIILHGYAFSAWMHARLDTAVWSWFDRQAELSIAARAGTEPLASSRRCNVLEGAFPHLFEEDVQDQVVPFDACAAKVAVPLRADRLRSRRLQHLRGKLIAGIVCVSLAPAATRTHDIPSTFPRR